MLKKILICVPTKNRPEMVEETLNYHAEYYKDCGIDIRYYDSSDNEDTRAVLQRFADAGLNNISWITTPVEQCLDCKLIDILRNDSVLHNYEYIWFISDSISIIREALDEIVMLTEDEYDLIRLPAAGAGCRGNMVVTDCVQWFRECSDQISLMASTIMRRTLLETPNLDFDEMEHRYIGNNDIHAPNHGFFFLVAFYLEQCLKLENFKGLMYGNRVKWRRESPLKDGNSYWRGMVFETWARSYPETILKLPDVYKDKEEVIRNSDNIRLGRFGSRALMSYRLQGLFNASVYQRYKRYFKLVSDVSLWRIMLIAYTPELIIKLLYGHHITDESEWRDRLHNLLPVLEKHEYIIVYGAGVFGERCVFELSKSPLRERLYGIAVTDKHENPESIYGFPVFEIADIMNFTGNSTILIATLPDTAKKIHKMLKCKNFRHIVELF